ncbi:ATP-binding protein [Consotaella salsifontis]|uniref:histidine kinase n=1 Tax=Consotaella salsifontis TaxID=1365950 RepID=A0A1T4RZI9_9HYPH|nr:ATP-binding protein [Consotaella salsifontis]SKA21430.1 Signal transduction histidine kinase [Consotaella salsifontis]
MMTLRARLALLITVAIVGVVIVAAIVTFQITDRRRDDSFGNTLARQIHIISRLIDGSPRRAREVGLMVGEEPPREAVVERLTRRMRRELAFYDQSMAVKAVRMPGGSQAISFLLRDGSWVYLPFPSGPPSPWRALTSYLLLIVIGAIAISLLAASKITRPMRMLEEAAASIGPGGSIAALPETGPVEVRETARAINRLSSRLRAAMESRMRLVASAGHDLRTPMTRMRLRAEFLPEEDRETWLKDLGELERIADSAIRLVREEVEETSVEWLRIDRMVAEIAGEMEEIGRKVALGPLAPAEVCCRPLAMKRAIRNLVQNAATHGGGALVGTGMEHDVAVVTVDDEGPGIPEELLGRVFEPFFRADPARRQFHPGAGLGLAIANEIVTQAGGTIEIANRSEGGLHQELRLPARAVAEKGIVLAPA